MRKGWRQVTGGGFLRVLFSLLLGLFSLFQGILVRLQSSGAMRGRKGSRGNKGRDKRENGDKRGGERQKGQEGEREVFMPR
jgi:hypothetical protein